MTIYYVAPDLARPSGGVRTIYRHVDALNRTGTPAAVVHARSGFRCRWFEHDTVIVHPPLALSPSDLLVVPEEHAPRLGMLAPGVPKVIFNQNAYRTFNGFRDPRRTTYATCPDLRGVIVVSDDSRRYLEHCFAGLEVRVVRDVVDPAVFSPEPSARRPCIAVMPAKRPHELRQLLAVLAARGALEGWDVVRIEGMREDEVAAVLRSSYLFLSLSRAEGFGLPPAEAIAAGCRVVGYHGIAGREYFREPYATAIEDGDVIAFAAAVEHALRTADFTDEETPRRGAAAITRRYSQAGQDADLAAAFTRFGAAGPGQDGGTLVSRQLPRRRAGARWLDRTRELALRRAT